MAKQVSEERTDRNRLVAAGEPQKNAIWQVERLSGSWGISKFTRTSC